MLARRRHPGGPNSLDDLCARYGIDSSRRTKHGALLDAEILAEVYVELIGGRQASLILVETGTKRRRPEPAGLRCGRARRRSAAAVGCGAATPMRPSSPALGERDLARLPAGG